MQTSWPGVDEKAHRDPYGNIYLSWEEKGGHKYCNKLLLCPWGKPMDQVRREAAEFHSNVLVPEGWLYVCMHCGSRRMDRYGIGAYDEADANGDPYIWGPECIANAVLFSEEEYKEGRERYDANLQSQRVP